MRDPPFLGICPWIFHLAVIAGSGKISTLGAWTIEKFSTKV